ncbi:MAG: DNA polymerase III subunit beta [Deltaproteobacteria bacterium]|jgi:DNA polymerase-3 subunit beta|nr:DNA polymerase III subunit beta [Deltaproteobacteria bacterium]
MLKAKVKREDLQKGLAQTSNIAGKFTSMPILANVLLETSGDRLLVSATDLEISFLATYEAEVSGEGKITVPSKTLSDIVHSLSSAEHIDLTEMDNQTLEVRTDTFRVEIYGLSPDDYPRIGDAEDVPMAEFGSDALTDAIGKTIYSVTTNNHNFNLAGIQWIKENKEGEEEAVRLVSSDSNRLNVATLRPSGIENFPADEGILVSRKGLNELKSLAEANSSVRIGVSVNQLACRAGNSVLIIRLLEGKFPDYNGLLPPPPTMSVELNRREIGDTLKRMSLLTTNKCRVIFLRFVQDWLYISTENPELGQAEEMVALDYSGEEVIIGFDPRHLLDAINSLRSERFRIKYVDQKTPVILTADDDAGWLCIISTVSPKDSYQT